MSKETRRNIALAPVKLFIGPLTGTRKLEIKGISREVYIFKSDKLAGLCLENGRILLNEKFFTKNAERAKEAVFLHEVGHEKSPLTRTLGGISQIILSPPGLVIGTIWVIALVSSYIYGKTFGLFEGITNSASLVVITFLVFLLASCLSYISELKADFFTINKIGLDNFSKSIEQKKKLFPERNLIRKLFIYPSHPPKKLTIRLYKMLEK